MNMHWHEGLFLQPHHLQIMQRRFQTEIRTARSLLAPNAFGVVEGKLSHDDLADGRIRFERLQVIMPSGQEIRFPEEANLPSLDVRPVMARGAGLLVVSLAVPLWAKNRANSFRIGEPPDPRIKLLYIPTEAPELADENSGENFQSVYLRKINARLFLPGEDDSDMECLPLLRIMRSVGEDAGKPRQDPDYVPPVLLLRSSPTLHDLVRELTAQLNASREQLRIKVTTGGLGLEVKWEITTRLMILNRTCASLTGLVEIGALPPGEVYLRLRELLGELLALHPGEKSFETQPYNHLDPLPVFRELDRKIRSEITVSAPNQPLKVVFSGSPGLLRATLEAQHLDKPTGYYLGVKTRVDRTKLALYLTDAVKFKLMPSSSEQIQIRGVELKEQNYPPLELPAQNDLHYFSLVPASNPRRWEQVKQDKAISLVWNQAEFDLSDANFTLYMTLSTSAA